VVRHRLELCSIIIVTHNNLEYTKQCLESIIRKTRYDKIELIVVDAHSTDGTLEYLSSTPEVRVVSLERNYPYSYSLNQGIQAAKGRYLCFMNNDIVIIQPNWLNLLVICAESDEKIGIVGPKFYGSNQSLISVDCQSVRRFRFSKFFIKTSKIIWGEGTQLPRFIYPDGEEYKILVEDDSITPCTYVVGACFLVKRKLIDKVGFFDEEFFFAYDETDYCVRSWKKGFKVVCNAKAKVIHLVGKTMKIVTEKDYDYDINRYENARVKFFRKHSSKDFELILKQAKGPAIFYLWKTKYDILGGLRVIGQGIKIIRTKGFIFFFRRAYHYIFQHKKQ
jgi:GT2 family glycosyltransferase